MKLSILCHEWVDNSNVYLKAIFSIVCDLREILTTEQKIKNFVGDLIRVWDGDLGRET